MVDKMIYIPNDDAQNYPFCRLQIVVNLLGLDTQLNEPKSPQGSKDNK